MSCAQVKHLREQIKKNVDVEALAGGLNKRKMLEQAVCNELCSMLDPGKQPYQPAKKKAKTMKEIRAKAIEITRCRFDARHGGAANKAADEVFGPVATDEPAEWEEEVDAEECEA